MSDNTSASFDGIENIELKEFTEKAYHDYSTPQRRNRVRRSRGRRKAVPGDGVGARRGSRGAAATRPHGR